MDEENGNKAIRLSITISKEISFVGHQNDVPFIRDIHITNNTDQDYCDLKLEMIVNPGFVSRKDWYISELLAGEEMNLRDRDTSLDGNMLRELVEPIKGDARFNLIADGKVVADCISQVRILARNEWGGGNSQPDLLAAFSMPNDPAIDRIISTGIDVLRRTGKGDVFDGYLTKDRDHVWRQVSAIWSAICGMNIKYALPPKSFEKTGQKIRLPSAISKNSLSTCLDTSMLFCSALEQIGLHPFVVITRGHAFVGVWLQPDTFSELPMEDVLTLRKRKDLKELIVFETTLSTQENPGRFSKAVAKGADQIKEEFENQFEFAVDIQRARDRQISPLSLTIEPPEEGEENNVQVILPVEEPEFSLGTYSDEEEEVAEVGPEGRIELWKRKLLDLTLRNPLLNFKTTQTNIPIVCPDPGRLEDILADGKQINILPMPKLTEEGGRDDAIHAQRTGNDLEIEHAKESLLKGRREVFVKEEKGKLESRLINLYRKAKKDLEEGGTNTLFLTIGSLSYVKEDRKGKVFKAPLILVPVELKRKSVRSGVKLVLHEDEPRFNTTLLQMFRQDLGLDIRGLEGDLPQDSSGVDVSAIWEMVRLKIKDVEGFELKEDVYLGTFSFAKYLMWKDLSDRSDKLKENSVVNHLIDREVGDSYPNNRDVPNPADLDKEIDPKTLFIPLPADSSQISAVIAAEKGQDFVIIGPPGTGKSQTISNMIVQLLGAGKKVLFVSEKAAALNVVYRRLKEVGLGEFCLELHSNKAKKIDVLTQLGSAWDVADFCSEEEWEAKAKQVKLLRDDLNRYVSELHEKHLNGLSVHVAIGLVVRHSNLPTFSLSFPSADIHSVEDLEAMKSIVHEMSIKAQELDDLSSNPLGIVEATEWSNAWQQRIVNVSGELRVDLEKLKQSSNSLLDALNLNNANPSFVFLETLYKLAELLTVADKMDISSALGPLARDKIAKLERSKTLLSYYEVARKKLSVIYKEHPWKSLLIEDVSVRWRYACASRWPFSAIKKGKIKKEMKFLGGVSTKKGNIDPVIDLPALKVMEEAGIEIERLDADLAPISVWKNYRSSIVQIDQYLTATKKLISLVPQIANDTDQLIAFKGHLRNLLGQGVKLLSEDAVIGGKVQTFIKDYDRCQISMREFSKEINKELEHITSDEQANPSTLVETCKYIELNQLRLNNWCSWQGIKAQALAHNLAPLVEGFEKGRIPIDRLEDAFNMAYCRWWAALKIDESDVLRTFNSRTHADKIAQFQEIDDSYRKLSAKYVRARICGQVPDKNGVPQNTEAGYIRKLLLQKRPRATVRKMIQDAPNFITELTPCVLMSPLSIAQYLPPDLKAFDVVIFDEASQITVWDAIGSIARAKQTIVAGDPKQMPPSNNFGRGSNQDDDQETEEDMESILDEMLSAGIPERHLDWHYRSRNESLITFSNHNYYGGRLITFPSPSTEDRAVNLERVDGVYALGQGRTNQIEAKAVVARIVKLLIDPNFIESRHTLGVVTFNAEQQNLIENLLDKERSTNPVVESHFSEELLEPIFVKNLENVQGDERDIIIFSLTYGKKAEGGRMSMNFGPLNKVGGERRLNVAITRARQQMIVFSSFDPDEIDLSRTSAIGVRDFKHFIEFAARGNRAIRERVSGSVGEYDSPFEVSVAEGLRKKGWVVHPQIGVSNFRIDIGVVHSDYPGKYLVGVECDGATYHSSATARDRDKVRESVLNGLGWNLVRIWSTDFWNDAQYEIDRVDREIREILEKDREQRLFLEEAKPLDVSTSQEVFIEDIAESEDTDLEDSEVVVTAIAIEASEIGLIEQEAPREQLLSGNFSSSNNRSNLIESGTYSIFRPNETDLVLDPELFYEDQYRSTIFKLANSIIDKEAPLTVSEVVNRVARLHGFKKSGNKIVKLVSEIVKRHHTVISEEDRDFVWPVSMSPGQWTTARIGIDPESKRDVDNICMEELVAFVRLHENSADPAEAVKKALGFSRLSTAKKARISSAVKIAISVGQ